MDLKRNIDSKELWGDDALPNTKTVFDSCLGYSATPGWAYIQYTIKKVFNGFEELNTIELGCGEGKVSLLFSLLGAKTTLVDYSPKQLNRAKYIADKFEVTPLIIEENLLRLPRSLCGCYDISMSFGTAEHFFGEDRQAIFDVHCQVLRKGGLCILWVPNRYGVLFLFGVKLRRLLHKQVCAIDEIPFTRKELFFRATHSGLSQIKVVGGDLLKNDFKNFVLNIHNLFGRFDNKGDNRDIKQMKKILLRSLIENKSSIMPWNNYLSYPLILIGKNL